MTVVRSTMLLRNRDGTPVDPVPFLVVAGLVVLVCFSFGPGYCLTLGLPLATGLAFSTLVCAFAIALAYHRFVRTFRPGLRVEGPPEERLRRLVYGVIPGIALVVFLSLPLLLR